MLVHIFAKNGTNLQYFTERWSKRGSSPFWVRSKYNQLESRGLHQHLTGFRHLQSEFFADKKKLYEAQSCHCGKYIKYPHIDSYCSRWDITKGPYCLLKGGSMAKYCPGARQIFRTNIYRTWDESICNASIGEFSRFLSFFSFCEFHVIFLLFINT